MTTSAYKYSLNETLKILMGEGSSVYMTHFKGECQSLRNVYTTDAR